MSADHIGSSLGVLLSAAHCVSEGVSTRKQQHFITSGNGAPTVIALIRRSRP
jgi:hypothetical protein